MNIQEVLLGGVPQQESQPMMGQGNMQTQSPAAANPFAGFLNAAKMMQEDPQGMEVKLREMAMRGIRPPEFTPETFLQYVQTHQSASNGAVQQAGQGNPAQGATPMMNMPPARGY